MTDRSVTHSTFVVERSYDASPARVFAAWADPKAKARWFAGPEEWGPDEFELDFRVGGREVSRGGAEGAGTRLVLTEQGAYLDDHDTSAQRQQGTGDLLDTLGAALAREPADRR